MHKQMIHIKEDNIVGASYQIIMEMWRNSPHYLNRSRRNCAIARRQLPDIL